MLTSYPWVRVYAISSRSRIRPNVYECYVEFLNSSVRIWSSSQRRHPDNLTQDEVDQVRRMLALDPKLLESRDGYTCLEIEFDTP